MILGVLKVGYQPENDRYFPPRAWRAGLPHPQQMQALSFREALSHDWRGERGEVWLYPLASQGGSPLRPAKVGAKLNIDIIERELGVKLFQSGIFIDLDDVEAHDKRSDVNVSQPEFYELVERVVAPFKRLPGAFYYRTARGARIGLIFAEPVELALGERARLAFFRQLTEMFEPHSNVCDVDKASKEITRGYAAPLITKRGRPIPAELPQLWMHPEDMSKAHVEILAQQWDAHLKQIAREAAANGERSPQATVSASAREGAAGQAARTRKAPAVLIPYDLKSRDLDGTAAHKLFHRSVIKLGSWVQDPELLEELAEVLDRHICDGRRKAKGDTERYAREALEYVEIHHDAEIPTPPKPADLDDFPELAPLRRHFSYPLDDLKIAQSLLESMGDTPAPLWHGDGLRRYDPERGIWRLYRRHQLERILAKLEGAQVENEKGEYKDIAIKHQALTSAIKMLGSITGAGEPETAFDTAPCGVVLGQHFVSAGLLGLVVHPRGPEHFAIHALEYDLSPQLLQYWEDEDTGRPPRPPTIFIEQFLSRSLHRAPDLDETPADIAQEISAKIITIGEWLGLALLGLCTREAVALVAHGPGSNGKSVLASLISDLFGAERTSHLAPQAMKERFSRAQLFGAAVNVVSEMPERDLLESDTLKAMISGDAIMVENKNEKPFRMIPRAAHFFAANTLPASRDRSHGLWRRLVPIEFHHIFTREDRDPELLQKLRGEYHLLVPWALDLARQYIERGGFTHAHSVEKWRATWRQETDAIAAFIATQTQPATTADGASAEDLWRAFREYAEEVGQSGAAKTSLVQFGRSLSAQPSVQRYRKRPEGAPRSTSPKTYYTLKLKHIVRKESFLGAAH